MKTRDAAVEGRFYPSSKKGIFDQIRNIESMGTYPDIGLEIGRVYGAILPHAGHIYSGHQTVPFFKLISRIKVIPDTFIIIHPNHTGLGLPVAIDDSDTWINSVGEVKLDHELASAMNLPFDHLSHVREHSAEVIIPFMQYYLPEGSFSIVPVCLLDQSYTSASGIASKISKAIEVTGRKTMVIASSDFSHFLSPDKGMEKDQLVIDQILSGNSSGVEQAVKEFHISVCGYGPIMVLMEYARSCNENYRSEILAKGHSGQVTPSREVVDYISMILFQ